MDWVEVPFQVQKEHAGMRLDTYLARRLHKYSRARVQKIINEGRVYRGRRLVKPASKLTGGETVTIRYPRTFEPPVPHEAMPILYEDGSIVVIDKPAGTLSHPTDKILNNSVTTITRRQLGRKVFLVHRLDRETSGALILALDSTSARVLNEQFAGREVQKQYLAVVFGQVAWKEKRVDAPLGSEGGAIRVRQAVSAGQTAVTVFQRIATDGKFSLVSARPRTGRLHQIRTHLAHLGHPIVGDKLYVGSGEAYLKAVRREIAREDLDALGADRQLLHSWKISFRHPSTGKRLEIEAPVPMDFPLRPEEAS